MSSCWRFFGSAANKDYKPVAIFAEVNPIPRTKSNPVLKHTGSHALSVGKIALLDARQGSRNLDRRFPAQAIKPNCIRTAPAPVKVFAYIDHS
jgi:hypothetical protein